MITARTLREGEPIPEGFNTGFERMPFMPEWIWIVEQDKTPAGVLIAAPMHGLIYLMRFCVKPGSDKTVALVLLRAMLKDTKARGFRGYIAHIDPTNSEENVLIPLCRKAGGAPLPLPQTMLVGSIDKAARY
jgi:hypothetical protein